MIDFGGGVVVEIRHRTLAFIMGCETAVVMC